jgi:hypothetical protein
MRIYDNSVAGRDVAHPISNPALARNLGEQLQPLSEQEINDTIAFTQTPDFSACIDDIANCDTQAFIAQNAPVANPLSQSFLSEHVLRLVNGEGPPSLEDTVNLAENIMGANFDPVTFDDVSEEAALGLAAEVRPDREIVQESQPALDIPTSADAAFPYVKTAIEFAPSGMDKFPVTEPLPSPSLYNVDLLNTEGVIYLKQYTTSASETGLVFRFQFAPQDISYQRTAQLQSDPTWGTNVQPKHFTMTSGKKINLGNIMLDGMTIGNTVTNSIKALEILMSINEKAPIAQVSPYCYKLIIGDRTLSDPFTNRHLPFVITSLQVKEEAYTPQGEVLHANVSLTLEEIPFYQVNDGRKLMMLFEGATSEDEDNCQNKANTIRTLNNSLEERASRWNNESPPWDLQEWQGSEQHAEFLTECASINEDFNQLVETRQEMRDDGCEDIPSSEGVTAYRSLWDGGFFGSVRGPQDAAQQAVNSRAWYDGFLDVTGSVFNETNTIQQGQQIMGSCVDVSEPNSEVDLQRGAAQDALSRLQNGSACRRRDLYMDNAVNVTQTAGQSYLSVATLGISDMVNAGRRGLDGFNDEEECVLALSELNDSTNARISQISDPQQRRFQELQQQQIARDQLTYMNQRYDELYNSSFLQLDDDACTANDNCNVWRTYGETMTYVADSTGNSSYLDELRGLSNDDN